VSDRQTLCEARDADPTTGTLLERLLAAYAGDYTLSPDETAELLFGDAAARPSDTYVAAFIAAALPILDAAFGSAEDDEDDEALPDADPHPLGSAIAQVLDWCLESGLRFPMTLVLVSRTGDILATRYPVGEAGELIVDRVQGSMMTLPINVLVTDEAGGAAHMRMAEDGTTGQLLVPPENAPLQS
jgi:hypothetical protein